MKALVIAGVVSTGGRADEEAESRAGKRDDSIFGVLPAEAVAGRRSVCICGGCGSFGELPAEDEGREKDRKSGGGSKFKMEFILLLRRTLLLVEMLSVSSLSLSCSICGGGGGRGSRGASLSGSSWS